MSSAAKLYDADFLAWTEHQAEALRAAAREGSNQPLDWENLAEEIEGLGKSDRKELYSRVGTIIEHLLKLEGSPSPGPRTGWTNTIIRERLELEILFEQSPSLRGHVANAMSFALPRRVKFALEALDQHGELTLAAEAKLRSAAYTPEQVLGDWFPENG